MLYTVPVRPCAHALLAVALASAAGCAGYHPPAVFGLPADAAGADLSAVWVGHATVLLKMGPQRVLTDPNLNGALFILPRETPASLRPEQLPPVDVVLISHLHFDHFDRWTLSELPKDVPVLFPETSQAYTTNLGRRRGYLGPWERVRVGGLTVTAVPVSHFGGRYGIDALWNSAYTGYVVQGYGRTVFFGGDTGYDPELFVEIGRRFPNIDLALLPIAPYRGDSGNRVHVDPEEALQIFADVGAKHMMPIHFEAYYGAFGRFGEPRAKLARLVAERGLEGRVHALVTGERLALPRGRAPLVIREVEPGADDQFVLRSSEE